MKNTEIWKSGHLVIWTLPLQTGISSRIRAHPKAKYAHFEKNNSFYTFSGVLFWYLGPSRGWGGVFTWEIATDVQPVTWMPSTWKCQNPTLMSEKSGKLTTCKIPSLWVKFCLNRAHLQRPEVLKNLPFCSTEIFLADWVHDWWK